MNKSITTKELVFSGLLLATGIILPMIFHVFGLTGPIALPMHIPVLIGGFLLPIPLALLLGIITPVISGVLTGMPIMFPMSIIMAAELGVYGLSASFLTRKYGLSTIATLVISMIFGRVAAGTAVAVLIQLFGIKMNPFNYVVGAVVTGLPGIIIQIVFIPRVIYGLKKYMNVKRA
jgi:hypothetical protein